MGEQASGAVAGTGRVGDASGCEEVERCSDSELGAVVPLKRVQSRAVLGM
jgi:hypothetical protein